MKCRRPKMKFVLSVLAVLGTASAALALTQPPDHRHSTSVLQSQDQMGDDGIDRVASGSDLSPGQTAMYFDPTPAPFNAYTYSASAQLVASGSQRRLRGEFRFPLFQSNDKRIGADNLVYQRRADAGQRSQDHRD